MSLWPSLNYNCCRRHVCEPQPDVCIVLVVDASFTESSDAATRSALRTAVLPLTEATGLFLDPFESESPIAWVRPCVLHTYLHFAHFVSVRYLKVCSAGHPRCADWAARWESRAGCWDSILCSLVLHAWLQLGWAHLNLVEACTMDDSVTLLLLVWRARLNCFLISDEPADLLRYWPQRLRRFVHPGDLGSNGLRCGLKCDDWCY